MHTYIVKYGIMAIILAIASLSSADPAQANAAKGVLQRLLGEQRAADFSLSMIPKENGADVFEVSAKDRKVDIKGSSGVALCRGAYSYLKETCNVLYAWDAKYIDLPEAFPDCPTTKYAPSSVVRPSCLGTAWAT